MPPRPGARRANWIHASPAGRPVPSKAHSGSTNLTLRSMQRWRQPCARRRSCLKRPGQSSMSPRARRFHSRKPGRYSRSLPMRSAAPEHAGFIGFRARRQRLRQEWARLFQHIDVVLCPPASTGPIRHDQQPDPHARSIEVNGKQRPYFDLILWACLASGAGLPAAVAPAMLGADGLPRGVQFVAASFEDAPPSLVPRCSKHSAQVLEPRRWQRLERGGRLTAKQFAIAAHASCKSGGLA